MPISNLKVVCPTRGLIFESMIQSLRENDIDLNDLVSGSGNLPHIQNELTKEALKDYPSYVLFIEEDMRMPPRALEKMIKAQGSIVAIEYAIDNGTSTVARYDDEILWCGLGCTLVTRSVLEAVGEPWFRNDYTYRIEEPFSLTKVETPNKYGGHDVNFCIRARELGYQIKVIPGVEAGHLRTPALARKQTNAGAYQINNLTIKNRHNFKESYG